MRVAQQESFKLYPVKMPRDMDVLKPKFYFISKSSESNVLPEYPLDNGSSQCRMGPGP
jgi:hypothetical protein